SFFFQAEDGIRDRNVTGVQTCALPIFLFVLLGILLIAGFLIPMGTIQSPIEGYETSVAASINGFLEGYNTMDALASLVFGILIIQIVRQLGISKRKDIFKYTLI